MKKIIKKYWVFLLSFTISTLINFPHLIPSYYLDGYCSLCDGFSNYALTFIKAGRYLTAGIYYLADLIKLNPAVFSVISIILSNLILSIAVQIIYKDVTQIVNRKNIKTKIIVYLGAFLICFNPMNIELYVFEESFIMCLGLLTAILAASCFVKKNKFYFIKSLSLLFISTCCYQSTTALFIPYIFLLMCIKNKDMTIIENIKNNYKSYIIGLICYGISLVLSFVSLKIVTLIFSLDSQKLGELNILKNIKTIVFLLKDTLSNFFNIINIHYFYGILASLIFMYIGYVIFDFKKNYPKLIYIYTMIALCLITAFVPNLAMNSLNNYTAARMTASIGAINGFILLLSFLFTENNNITNYLQSVILTIGITAASIYSLTYFNVSYDNLNRYKQDINYVNSIKKVIKDYESKNQKIENIQFAINPYINHYYKEPYNTINIKVNAVDWGLYCILKSNINNKFNIIQKSTDEILEMKLIETPNFKYAFDETTMYLLILY